MPLENQPFIERCMEEFQEDPSQLIKSDRDRSFHLVARATELIDYRVPFIPDDTQAEEEANEADEGTVFEQTQEAGTEVDKGTSISYKVSTGPDTVDVPDLRGYSESAAKQMLDELKLSYSVTYDYDESMSAGNVISYSPGGSVEPGTTIQLVVSQGALPTTGSVPNVTGATQGSAESDITAAGFNVSVQVESSSSVAEGNVIRYSPSGEQEFGTTITIVVSGGPGASAGTEPDPETPSTGTSGGSSSTGGDETAN